MGRLGFEGTFGSVRRATGLGFVGTAKGPLVLWEGLISREGLVLWEELQGLVLWEQ